MEGGRETRLGSPASRLRRRCRSEGLERSPFDLHPQPYRSTDDLSHVIPPGYSPHRSYLRLSGMERGQSVHISSFPPLSVPNEFPVTTAHLGEHYMANQHNRNSQHSPTRSPRYLKESPSKLRRASPHRLPRVEELLEKTDLMDFEQPKQPLKSILNNPRKSPPPGILKKKKLPEGKKEEGKSEGRRRQRALSESEYVYGSLDGQRGIFESNGHRIPVLSNTKRMRDNSGTVFLNNTLYGPRHPGVPRNLPSPSHRGQLLEQKSHPSTPEQRCRPCSPECKNRTSSPESRSRFDSPEYKSLPSSPECNGHGSPSGFRDWQMECQARLHHENVLRTTAIGAYSEAMDEALTPPIAQIPVVKPPPEPAPPPPRASAKKPLRARKAKAKSKRSRRADQAGDADPQDVTERAVASPPLMETECAAGERAGGRPLETPEQASVRQLSDKLTNGAFVSGTAREKGHTNLILATLRTTNPFKAPMKMKAESPVPECMAGCVRASLFPRVPPYLRFVAHDATPPLAPPPALARHLKWKLTSITPIVVKKTLLNSGFKLVRSECDTAECPQEETVDWVGIWGKHMKSIMFRAIKDGQKMNHFPGTFQIGRKDRLWRNLQKLVARHGSKEFGIMPKTYVLPHDMKLLKRDWEKYAARNEKWIIKPPASARGTGIAVVSRWAEIPKKKSVVVQRYVAKPYLINGSKFDLRLYVLLTSVHPLKIYLYNDGLARFASVKYTEEVSSLHDRYMHLTNYSINRLSKNYAQNEDAAACQGHKWTLQTLLQYLKRERLVDTAALWEDLKALVVKTIISGEGSIRSLTDSNITSRYNCYELFGVDVLLDEDLKPWLLEVNISPSLHSSSPLDLHVKGPLVAAVLNIAQFHVPSRTNLEGPNKEKHTGKYAGVPYDPRLYTVYLSKEERDKHIIYTKMEDRDEYISDILTTLTPDDVRHLIQAEDELTALASAGGMQRIFPTPVTHKYLGFLPAPRYYNRLLDAWETKYRNDRASGIELLRSLCEMGYHLEVPAVPLKNDVDATPSLSDYAPEGSASLLSLEVVAAAAPAAPAAPAAAAGLRGELRECAVRA